MVAAAGYKGTCKLRSSGSPQPRATGIELNVAVCVQKEDALRFHMRQVESSTSASARLNMTRSSLKGFLNRALFAYKNGRFAKAVFSS